jgi:hypothetical protein
MLCSLHRNGMSENHKLFTEREAIICSRIKYINVRKPGGNLGQIQTSGSKQ